MWTRVDAAAGWWRGCLERAARAWALAVVLVVCIVGEDRAGAQSTAWEQVQPTARGEHGVAYDAARGVTVLFGGAQGTVRNAESWEWNGAGWKQRMVSGPGARNFHAMAYDAGRGVVVLFGGFREDLGGGAG